jgi:hypothetical protein
MQDIAGCRVLVDNLVVQSIVVRKLSQIFESAVFVDRLKKPSYGYRAVHIIVRSDDRTIEIQVRTVLQDTWAQLSERMAANIDPALKYGGGPKAERLRLEEASDLIRRMEFYEAPAVGLEKEAMQSPIPKALQAHVLELCADVELRKREVINWLHRLISEVPGRNGEGRVFPD